MSFFATIDPCIIVARGGQGEGYQGDERDQGKEHCTRGEEDRRCSDQERSHQKESPSILRRPSPTLKAWELLVACQGTTTHETLRSTLSGLSTSSSLVFASEVGQIRADTILSRGCRCWRTSYINKLSKFKPRSTIEVQIMVRYPCRRRPHNGDTDVVNADFCG